MTAVGVLTKIVFSAHAIERVRERVYPACDNAAVGAKLDALAPSAHIAPTRPAFISRENYQTAELWMVIGDLAFPLVRVVASNGDEYWVATTCLVRGGMSPKARQRRRAARTNRKCDRRIRERARDPR